LGTGYAGNLKKEFLFASVHLSHPLEWLEAVVLSWYLLWPLFVMGITMLPAKGFPLLVCSGLLTVGAVFLSSFVLDTERTYSILAPLMAIGAANVFEILWEDHRAKAIGLLTVVLAQIAAGGGIPNWAQEPSPTGPLFRSSNHLHRIHIYDLSSPGT
jgi:peptidoglycan/LPS O-acetylase OafA/YrhL